MYIHVQYINTDSRISNLPSLALSSPEFFISHSLATLLVRCTVMASVAACFLRNEVYDIAERESGTKPAQVDPAVWRRTPCDERSFRLKSLLNNQEKHRCAVWWSIAIESTYLIRTKWADWSPLTPTSFCPFVDSSILFSYNTFCHTVCGLRLSLCL